jgi:hypothetical protein
MKQIRNSGVSRAACWHRLCRAAHDPGQVRSIVLASAALAAVVYCILLAVYPREPVPEPFAFPDDATWITTASKQESTGCFRLDLTFPGKVVNAWIALATNGGFDVTANGNGCAQFFLWRRTRPFQTSLSEEGQKLNPEDAAMSVNFPREYQWADHDNAELPIWIDLTPYLHAGHNAICIEVESNGITPALILSGEVQLTTGERIPIRSGTQWAAEPVPRRLPEGAWTSAYPLVPDWDRARMLPWKRSFWRLVPQGVFEEPFRGERIRSIATGAITWIEQDFDLTGRPLEGFLRVVTDTPFQVWINEHAVQPRSAQPSVLGYGPWLFRELARSPLDIVLDSPAERLASNQTATLLPGQQGENLSGRDPVGNNFIPDQTPVGGTANNPTTNGNLAPNSSALGMGKNSGSNPYANLKNPDNIVPPALTRDRRRTESLAYSISPLLREGRNTVRIGLYKDEPEAAGLSRQPFFAFDGGIKAANGNSSFFSNASATRTFSSADGEAKDGLRQAAIDGPIEPILLPQKEVFGYVYPDRPWFQVSVGLFFVCAGTLLFSSSRAPKLAGLLKSGSTACAVLAGWVAAGTLLRSAVLERSEALFWRFQAAPLVLLTAGLAGAALALALQRRKPKANWRDPLDDEPAPPKITNRDWIWRILVGAGVVLCFVLRAWQIDLQPPDEDEYASIQATLAIAQKGVPEYQEGVWYTRSPAYHYLAGAVAVVTGGNIYSLRLLTVFFSCATAILIWKIARELTHNRFLAFCALVLFAIHPFLIFTGHVARFYQQQQFFHLLGVYFFIRGFIANSGMRDRYLTVLAFFLATLSQEITVLQILPLVVCCLLYARRRSWPDEIRLLVAAGCAMALIALDLAFFKIQCLTALDGISPRVDATIGWSFEKPTNLFALLVGYSRLHLIPSVFLLTGFLIAWRTKNNRWTFLYVYLFLSVVVVNLLITSRGFRFEYHLIPLWILLSVYGMGECARLLIPARTQSPQRLSLAIGWLAIILCSWSPWRILKSYDSMLQADPVRALRYVANNLRAGDRVAISELYPQAALLEAGRADYDIAVPILYDFALRKKGKLVDRNAAAEVLGNLDELQRAFAKNQRLWIVFDRDQMHARGNDIRWEYPGGRILLYLRNNAHLVFRSSLWSVYLWDQNAGEYSSFREKPGNWFD